MSLYPSSPSPIEENTNDRLYTLLNIPLTVKRASEDIDIRQRGKPVPLNYSDKLAWADYSAGKTHGELNVWGVVDGILCVKAVFVIEIKTARHIVGRVRAGKGWRDSTPDDLDRYLLHTTGENRVWTHLSFY